MWAIIEAVTHVIDWRFGLGLLLGFILTLRYVVIGIYHPMLRDMEGANSAQSDDDI